LEARAISLDKEDVQEHTLDECNASLLHTMLFNLINNAIKYNIEGGSIVLTGRYAAAGYTLDIHDTGIGIAAENLPFIFNRFKRLEKTDSESFGLGLPIVQTIADLHHIKIDVNSIPGKGSTFSLTFSLNDRTPPHKLVSSRVAKGV
jgi:two-component system, OmpR family, sensor histidine kinase ArlS